MALKILSGIIIPYGQFTKAGSATVDFYPHTIAGDVEQPGGQDMMALGPDKPFISQPCKVVSLRHIEFTDIDATNLFQEPRGSEAKRFNINDSFDPTGHNSLTIKWNAQGQDAKIWEISYMVVGEVEGANPRNEEKPRVISGILVAKTGSREEGSATIHFNPHTITGDIDETQAEKNEIGPRKSFKGQPCKVVSIRQMTFWDDDTTSRGPLIQPPSLFDGGLQSLDISDTFDLDDPGKESLRITWKANNPDLTGIQLGGYHGIHEISYMVFGLVEP